MWETLCRVLALLWFLAFWAVSLLGWATSCVISSNVAYAKGRAVLFLLSISLTFRVVLCDAGEKCIPVGHGLLWLHLRLIRSLAIMSQYLASRLFDLSKDSIPTCMRTWSHPFYKTIQTLKSYSPFKTLQTKLCASYGISSPDIHTFP